MEKNLSPEKLNRRCEDIPLLPPIHQRIVAMILSIPEHDGIPLETPGVSERCLSGLAG